MSKSVATSEKNISEKVLSRVQELKKTGDLVIPPGYSAENAMKSAWLMLQEMKDRSNKPVLQSCSKDSIANSLLDMVIQGLSPAKKQCYFIPYGGKLQLSRSYLGTIAVTKRLKGVKNVVANCIYEGDEFEYVFDLDTGEKKIAKHNQKFENIDPAKIKGAYAIVVTDDGIPNRIEVMNINMIRKAWGQGAAKGKSGAHMNFADEMAKKTVINRACKMYSNTSDDSDILVEAMNNTDKTYDKEELIDDVKYEVAEEIEQEANQETLDIKNEEVKTEIIDAEIVEPDNEEDAPY